MYLIEKDRLGNMELYRLKLSGFMKSEEVRQWVSDTAEKIGASSRPFSIAMDMRTLMPLSADALSTMKDGLKLFVAHGMIREAVLVPNPITQLHFEHLAEESGDAEWVKYFAATEPDWESAMNDWMEKGKYTPSQIPPAPFIA